MAQGRSLFDATAGWALPRDRLGELAPLPQAAQNTGHELRCHSPAAELPIEAAAADMPPAPVVLPPAQDEIRAPAETEAGAEVAS